MIRGWATAAVLIPELLISSLPAAGMAQSAERMYQDAFDARDMIACNIFGFLYEHGEGVGRGLARAAPPARAASWWDARISGSSVVIFWPRWASWTLPA